MFPRRSGSARRRPSSVEMAPSPSGGRRPIAPSEGQRRCAPLVPSRCSEVEGQGLSRIWPASFLGRRDSETRRRFAVATLTYLAGCPNIPAAQWGGLVASRIARDCHEGSCCTALAKARRATTTCKNANISYKPVELSGQSHDPSSFADCTGAQARLLRNVPPGEADLFSFQSSASAMEPFDPSAKVTLNATAGRAHNLLSRSDCSAP
jgi:hypothetical protein